MAVSARGRDMQSRHCQLSRPWYASLCRWRDGSGRKIVFEVRARQFVPDSALEGTGFEPSVPLLRKALLGVANRRRRHERRSHLQVQVCLEWLPIAFAFAEGPRVRIRLPPEKSLLRTLNLSIRLS